MDKAIELAPGMELFYTLDDFTDPWVESETILLVHGLAESAQSWYGWVPELGREYRILRPDLRGFGRSTPMARDFPWSLDLLAADLGRLVDNVVGGPVHVVGAKIGSTISVRFATTRPDLVKTLTLIGLPVKGSRKRPGLDPETHGVRIWARSSMEERLGEDASPEMLEYWSDLMGKTALSTLLGFSHAVGDFDVSDDLAKIACPVLALGTDSARHPASEMDAWRQKIANCQAAIIDGEGYHAAAIYPDVCASCVSTFIGITEDE